MKGDFSRTSFDARKRYSGVLMQQGRVQTDADWNEQEAIVRRRARLLSRDVVGHCGGPADNAGFGISVSGTTLTIGAGRYYVDGLMCENDAAAPFGSQPDLPAPVDWVETLTQAKATFGMAYLDVWERHLTALDDPLMREVALGGPDTATRIKTVWQVKVLPLAIDDSRVRDIQKRRTAAQKKLADLQAAGGNPQEIAKLQAELAKIDLEIAAAADGPACGTTFPEWDALIADPDRRLNARTQAPSAPAGPCIVPPAAGYRRLENQLYRVEVHTPGPLGTATFKWSRDNGTVVTAIEKISGKEVTVTSLGPDEVLGFASGQWVEISDDRSELLGEPGQLVQIDGVNASLRRLTLKSAPIPLASGADGVDRARHPKLRRWDQNGDTAGANGVATTAAWLPLEDGIAVQFGSGTFRTGDYWTIPARTATGEIEWPPFAVPNTSPEPQRPHGIRHHFCRLALLALDAEKKTWSVVEDCRELFPPLTEPCCDDTALHVTATNWQNDDFLPSSTLSRDGLRITLDRAADPLSLTPDTVQVLLEFPYSTGQGQPSNPNVMQRVHMRGVVTRDAADPRVIVWRPEVLGTAPGGTAPGGTAPPPGGGTVSPGTPTPGTGTVTPGVISPDIRLVSEFIDPLVLRELGTRVTPAPSRAPAAGRAGARKRTAEAAAAPVTASRATATVAAVAQPTVLFRVRIILKGHLIWSEKGRGGHRAALDGQAFGTAGVRSDGSSRIALRFPSGHSAAGSDFESWFLLGAPTQTRLQVSSVRFTRANNENSSAGDITLPLPAGQQVTFKAGEEIMFVRVTFTRPVTEASLGNLNAPALFVEVVGAAGGVRVTAAIALESPTVARLALREPFKPGAYVLVGLGTQASNGPPPITSSDDGSALDGNYDNQPGADFRMPFTAA